MQVVQAQPPGIPKIDQGSIVFASKVGQRASTMVLHTTLRGSNEYILKVLGLWKVGNPLPTMNELMRLESGIGWFGGDDIAEALGEEAFAKLVAHVVAKYPV